MQWTKFYMRPGPVGTLPCVVVVEANEALLLADWYEQKGDKASAGMIQRAVLPVAAMTQQTNLFEISDGS